MMIYLGGVFSPVMEVKGSLMSLDLDNALSYQSGSNIGKQFFWVSILLFSVVNYFKFGRAKLKNSLSFLCFVVILFLLAMSCLWSDYPEIIIKRFLLQIILILSIALSIACLRSEKQLVNILYYSFSFIAIYNLLFIVLFPYYSFDASNALSGIYKGKNYLGFIALSGLIITVSKYHIMTTLKEKRQVGFFCVLWTIFLFLSLSKTCILVGLIFITLWGVKATKKIEFAFIKVLFYCLASFYLLTPLLSYIFMGEVFACFEEAFRNIDLTGRGEIWNLAIDSARDNVLLGVGYATFWGVGEIPFNFDVEYSYLMYLNQSHNGYLDFLLQLGFTGLCILFLFLFFFIKNDYAKLPKGFRYMTIFVLIHNITESSMFRDTHFMWLLFLIIIVSSWFKFTEDDS
jgi:O-antigen ligase